MTQMSRPYTLQGYPIYELSTIVFFLVPIVILSYFYACMGVTLCKGVRVSQAVSTGASVHGEQQRNSSRRQITYMLGKLNYG